MNKGPMLSIGLFCLKKACLGFLTLEALCFVELMHEEALRKLSTRFGALGMEE
jgi:hypothetical protein